MNNYEHMAREARALFLRWDAKKMIARAHLRADEEKIYVDFLGDHYAIRRDSGRILPLNGAPAADFNTVMSIYDGICRDTPLAPPGAWRATDSLDTGAQASPNGDKLFAPHVRILSGREAAMAEALVQMRLADFYAGDIACVFPVFSFLPAVFQYWQGDDEFAPRVRFLWPENALSMLHFETLWYVMGAFFARLEARITAIERN